jgi:3-deoxy-D-manno-octulosonic-acid transferase
VNDSTIGKSAGGRSRLFLLDSIGELRLAYSLADLVIVGRSFGALHGSDMIEPIALGKATIVGPAVADFQDAMDALLAGNGVVQTSAEQLRSDLGRLLHDRAERERLADCGRRIIRKNQGATEQTASLVLNLLKRSFNLD